MESVGRKELAHQHGDRDGDSFVPARASSSAAVINRRRCERDRGASLRGGNERMRAEIMGGALRSRAPARVDAVETEAATEAEEPVASSRRARSSRSSRDGDGGRDDE